VAVALIIGGIEIISILTEKLGIDSGPLAWIAGLNLNYVGYAIVGLFLATWIIALLVWRYGRIEEKWTAQLAPRTEG
jgi:high-affinity nickel-transport protein